jgi:hypothetical protein
MVDSKTALAAAATVVALAFAASTFDRWLSRGRRHELAWSISLLQFAVASAALWVGATAGWDLPTFRVFFLFGAILNVPWLALGSIYLLGGQRTGDRWAVVVSLLSAMAIGVMIAAPTKAPLPASGLPQGREVFGVLPRVLAAAASGVAATFVIVAAIWSAVRLLRGHSRSANAPAVARPGQLALGNVIIALGTAILGASGTLTGRLGQEQAFSVTLAVGIVLLFAGFLIATGASAPRSTKPIPTVDLTTDGGDASAKHSSQELAAESLR